MTALHGTNGHGEGSILYMLYLEAYAAHAAGFVGKETVINAYASYLAMLHPDDPDQRAIFLQRHIRELDGRAG